MGKLTKQQQAMIVAVVVLIFGGYFYWNYLLKPTLDTIAERRAKYNDLVAKIETAERQARRLPALQIELAQLQQEMGNLEKQLPKDKDLPTIIRTLTKEAIAQNLKFSRLTPKDVITQQYFEVIPFEVQFTGSLHALGRFLASLGQQDRIFQAQNVTLAPATGNAESLGGQNLNIQLTIQTYAYKGS